MPEVSKSVLKAVSATVWLSGAVVLLLKGASLYLQATALKPEATWSWLAVAAALFVGGAKARLLFRGFCRKNLDRIAALDDPKLWHAFRPQFYAFLASMVVLGAVLSRLAIGNYPGLLAMAVLDISIAIALLGSLREFSQHSS